ncbi:extracellular solute-binding protein [Salinarimonas chemoclinalis]|uniref:extracellular solute-binding protein n=1 Tax=Salinarimonas chemoclinalis TaxID=3241599 RepID=UPI0035567D1F
MLDLNDLRLFVHIVDYQGILKAARALALPKSTISRRLASLEESLRARLIVRSGEDFALTPVGAEVYAHGLAMVEAARRAEERLLEARREIGGNVSLSVCDLFAPLLPELLARITAAHPRLALSVEIAERDADQIGDGFDLVLRAHHWTLRDSALVQRRVARNPLVVVGTRASLDRAGHPADPADLAAADVLVYGLASTTPWSFRGEDGSETGVALAPRLVSVSVALLREAALANAGLAIVPEIAVREDLAAGRLLRTLPGFAAPPIAVTLLTPPRRLMSATTRLVADTLAEAAKAHALAAGVPWMGPRIPLSRPANVVQTSCAAPTPVVPVAEDGCPNDLESETTMTPILKAVGAAALSAGLASAALAQDATGPLVLYTNDFEGVVTERFEADTGREIDVVQMSGGELLARIAAEASNPQWDALIFNGSYVMHGLDLQEQLLRGVTPANLDNLNEIGRTYLPESLSWFPIGLSSSCVMLYRTDLVENPPATFEDLADPRFNGMVGMADPAVAAPAYPCVAQFFHARGFEDAQGLFSSLFENGLRVFRTNGPVGRAIASGDVSVALITSQVAFSLKATGAPVEVVWPEEGAPGSVRGVAIQARTARPEGAKAFVEWLLEPATQTYLAQAVPSDGLFEPTVVGAERRADGPPEGAVYRVAPDAFAVEHEEAIKTWFADQALN